MKLSISISALLVLFVSGARAADGDLDAACRTTSPACTDTHASCQSSVCKCNPNFVKKGSACVPVVGMQCGRGQCLNLGVCTNSLCACDTANGFAAGSSGDTSCSCPSTKMMSGGVCYLKNGETCSAVADCYPSDGKICDTTCKCDTTKGWAAATAGNTGCTCDTTKAAGSPVNGKCLLKVDQPCSTASDCITTDGMICGTRGGSTKCTCDTSKAYQTGAAGEATCSCPSTTHAKKADKSCGKVIDEICTATSECIDYATCTNDGGTMKCKCDTAKNFAVGTAGDRSCACNATKAAGTPVNGMCPLKVGEACTADSDCIVTTGMTCAIVGGSKKCTCDTTKNFLAGSNGDDTCTCASNYTLKADGSCGKVIDQTCTSSSQCIDNAVCINDAGTLKCKCDTTKNFAAGTTDATSCSCNSTKAAGTPVNGVCPLKVGQACNAATDCIAVPGMTCANVGGTNKCTCDTTKNFLAGSNGDFTCTCDTAKAASSPISGYCPLKVGQVCTAITDCISTDGMVCADRSGTVKCTCDTSKNYVAGTDGDTTCACAANHHKNTAKMCALVIDQTCSASGTPCIDDAICDPVTLKCVCDTGNGFAAGSALATSCSCHTDYVSTFWGCGKKVGQPCSDVCGDYAACNSTFGVCACSSGAVLEDNGSTCKNGGETLVSSLAVLAAGLLIALRRM